MCKHWEKGSWWAQISTDKAIGLGAEISGDWGADRHVTLHLWLPVVHISGGWMPFVVF